MIIRSSLNYCNQSIIIGSSQDFKFDNFDISLIYTDISTIYFDISHIFYRKIKLTRAYITDPIFPRYISPKPIYQSKTNILAIYHRYYRFFAHFSLILLSIVDIISNDISDIFNPTLPNKAKGLKQGLKRERREAKMKPNERAPKKQREDYE